MPVLEHFGVRIRPKTNRQKLTRENYVVINNKCTTHEADSNHYEIFWGKERRNEFLSIYTDESATTYTEQWCQRQKEKALKNFELNMRYYSSLDRKDFNKSLNKFLKKYKKFRQIENINIVDGKSGYYLLVLDEYCQVYVGTSNDIRSRIMNHWSKTMKLDRLVFGDIKKSKLSIDSFMPLDTTRVYVFETKNTYNVENELINALPGSYICNRTSGGIPEFGKMSIAANAKYHDL